ncbi:MAG: divalent cation transporter [Candidatus Muiribacterium halophilum]|uniref:Divalent cation transporter n=1 Tax=Muiribacterium halophilum TaxID=2053465 RepID=A0A2N5ZIK1_MUIH1|nr:MAG: divalent cation transporter [Candidatus Muirbacterium halophilum]
MNNTLQVILYSIGAGLPIIIGGLLSKFFEKIRFKLKDEFNHWVVAFGGGALLSAIAFALVPRAIETMGILDMSVFFLAGTFSFMYIDIIIAKKGGTYAQFISMMSDFIPEAMILGASFAKDNKFGLLLALFIGLQNLPEGFNAFKELKKQFKESTTLILMTMMSFIGVFAALFGEFFLTGKEGALGYIMLYAAGGILYLIFQDIAPLSKKKNDWIPATGASIGFVIGMIGEKLLS